MKKYLKLKLFSLLLVMLSINVAAQGGIDDDGDMPVPENPNSNVPGKQSTPIDDYSTILIISAVAIASIYCYKERKIIKK